MNEGPFSPLLLQYHTAKRWNRKNKSSSSRTAAASPHDRVQHLRLVPKCKNCDVSLTYHKG